MRQNNSGGTGATRIPVTTRSGTSTRVPPRTPASTRSSVSHVGTGVLPPLSQGSSQCTPNRSLGGVRTTTSSSASTAAARGAAAATGPVRRGPPKPSNDALQAELDALADDFYQHGPSTAPVAAYASADGPYNKAEEVEQCSVALLRDQTTWYEGPTNPSGRTFDASDSNLLCMDVLVPPPTAGGVGGAGAARRGPASLCVVGSADHGLKVFDLASMREVKSLYTKTCGHTEWVTSCRFLADRRVLSGGMDAKLCLWADVTRGGPARCVDLLGHTGSISQVDVNERHDRAIAMSASYDRTIRLWELSGSSVGVGGGREVGCLSGHKGPVTQFSWRETQVLSGDRQGAVKLWDVETAQCRLTASSKRGQIGSLGHLVHPAVGHLVLFGDQGGVLTVLDARAPPKTRPVFQEELHPGGMVTFIRTPSPTAVAAPLIVTCGADKRVVVRDARRDYAEVYALRDHDDFVYSMEIIGDLLLTGTGNGRLLVHKVETGELCYELDANAAAVREIFASPGKLVTSGDDGKAKVFDFM